MRKIVTTLVAAGFVAVTAIATSGAASARPWGWHGGWYGGPGPFVGGLVAGAVVGGALAAPYYYPYGYYGPYGPYPYRRCAWRSVWNGYRWVRACY